jgi:RNA polymerase sigma factor (sigma-70 family)
VSAPPNPLHSSSPSDWERLIEAVEPAALLILIERRMSPGLRRLYTPEDVLQESLLQAWKSRAEHEWRGIKSFRAWLVAIIEHRIHDLADRAGAAKRDGGRPALSLARHRDGSTTAASESPPAASTTPSRLAMYREQAESMLHALEGLPEDVREIVRLRLFEELTLEEIAAKLGLGPSAVGRRFRKGSELYVRRLRTALGSQTGDARGQREARPGGPQAAPPESSRGVETPDEP